MPEICNASEIECCGSFLFRYSVIITFTCHQLNGYTDEKMVASGSQLIMCFWTLDKLLILKSCCQYLFPPPSCQEHFLVVLRVVHLWICLPGYLDDEITGLHVT